MKKLYIKPSIEFEVIETADILHSSWKKDEDDAITGGGTSTELGGGDHTEIGDAKESTFIWDDEF